MATPDYDDTDFEHDDVDPDTVRLTREELSGDIAAFLIDRIRGLPKVWAQMTETEQEGHIYSAREAAERVVRKAVHMIAADGRRVITANLDKVVIKDAIQGTITLPKHDENRHAFVDAQGQTVLIVVADSDTYVGGATPEADPDEPELPIGDPEAAADEDGDPEPEEDPDPAPEPPKKRRGRPRKLKPEEQPAGPAESQAAAEPAPEPEAAAVEAPRPRIVVYYAKGEMFSSMGPQAAADWLTRVASLADAHGLAGLREHNAGAIEQMPSDLRRHVLSYFDEREADVGLPETPAGELEPETPVAANDEPAANDDDLFEDEPLDRDPPPDLAAAMPEALRRPRPGESTDAAE